MRGDQVCHGENLTTSSLFPLQAVFSRQDLQGFLAAFRATREAKEHQCLEEYT